LIESKNPSNEIAVIVSEKILSNMTSESEFEIENFGVVVVRVGLKEKLKNVLQLEEEGKKVLRFLPISISSFR